MPAGRSTEPRGRSKHSTNRLRSARGMSLPPLRRRVSLPLEYYADLPYAVSFGPADWVTCSSPVHIWTSTSIGEPADAIDYSDGAML